MGVRPDVAHVRGTAAVFGDDPERVPFEAVSHGCAPLPAGRAAGRLRKRVAGQGHSPEETPPDRRVCDTLLERARQPVLVHPSEHRSGLYAGPACGHPAGSRRGAAQVRSAPWSGPAGCRPCAGAWVRAVPRTVAALIGAMLLAAGSAESLTRAPDSTDRPATVTHADWFVEYQLRAWSPAPALYALWASWMPVLLRAQLSRAAERPISAQVAAEVLNTFTPSTSPPPGPATMRALRGVAAPANRPPSAANAPALAVRGAVCVVLRQILVRSARQNSPRASHAPSWGLRWGSCHLLQADKWGGGPARSVPGPR